MGSYFINADFGSISDTSQLKIPSNPLERVIGQDDAVRIARIAARQRRHLLLVGPPGVGKSMIAQAMSFFIDRPKEEVRVLHNPEYPERPFIEIKTATQIEQEREELNAAEGILIDPENVSFEISERLGFRCTKCGFLSSYNESICPSCNQQKTNSTGQGPFGDVFNVIGAAFGVQSSPEKVTSTRKNGDHDERKPHLVHLNPNLSEISKETFSGSIRIPSAAFNSSLSCSICVAVLISMNGLSGYSGLCSTLTSSFGLSMKNDIA